MKPSSPKRFFFIVVFLALGVLVFSLARGPFAGAKEKFPAATAVPAVFDCKALRAQIEKELDQANACETDADCKVVSLGGPYTELGCHKYINRSVNQVRLYEKVERYYNSCYQKIDACEPMTKPVCADKKCVAPR
jgi:hypothetical protein